VDGAFYLPTGEPDRLVATGHTGGPWDPAMQHGGPPSALLARAVEQEPVAVPSTVVRMAVEILGPVPVGEVTVSSRVARAGRSVELVEAELTAGGRVAVRARAWRIRVADLDLPAAASSTAAAPPMPGEDLADTPPLPGGFLGAMQLRFAVGSWSDPGPATVWAHQLVPLVADEEPTGLQRLMVLADCGNGVSGVLPLTDWLFINPDLTVHLSRYPSGPWLCLEARTTTDPHGFGVAVSTLYDATGPVGYGAQSLFVARRERADGP
jgi:Thioesterase-like superfamily